jgi:peptide-methionine (S)-S-oxide reductase
MMQHIFGRLTQPILNATVALALICGLTSATAPAIAAQADAQSSSGRESIVLAGGCFWGMEAVFGALEGVASAVPGYAGGGAATARYEIVSTGMTGHAEAVEVHYDPARISLRTILKIYFSIAHDPTQLNRQGPDTGKQYRSTIFFRNEEQKRTASAYIRELAEARAYQAPIVTTLEPLVAFFPAEEYHRDYVARHPADPYVAFNDLPKLRALRARYPELVRSAAK